MGTLNAEQSESIPTLSDDIGVVRFVVAVSASCRDASDRLALIASIADTTVSATVAGDDPPGDTLINLDVPVGQLSGMQTTLLCKRLQTGETVTPRTLIRDAFSAHITGICTASDDSEKQRSVNAALDVYIDCGVSPGPDGEPEN